MEPVALPVHESWPENLYRYRPANSDLDMDRLRSIFVGHEMYFSSASSLNDPFDCAPVFEVTETRHQLETYLRTIARREASHLTAAERKRYIDGRLGNRQVLERELRDAFFDVIGKIAVCCFASSWDNPLMWSHYAGGHTGVCIEIAGRARGTFLSLPVRYSNLRPIVTPTKFARMAGDELIDQVLLTKSDDWKYEAEKRAIVQRVGAGPQPFSPETITRIILGYKISNARAQHVVQLAREGGLTCEIAKAELHPREFGFQLRVVAGG